MKALALTAILLIPSLSLADDKPIVNLSASGHATSGGSDRVKMPEVEVTKGFGFKEKKDIPVAEQIAALRSQIAYLTLIQKHGIDISKEITVTYAEKPVADAIKELLPGVPVKFDGETEKATVKRLEADKAHLSAVIKWLDDAAGVYFVFSEEGITVSAEPPAIP